MWIIVYSPGFVVRDRKGACAAGRHRRGGAAEGQDGAGVRHGFLRLVLCISPAGATDLFESKEDANEFIRNNGRDCANCVLEEKLAGKRRIPLPLIIAGPGHEIRSRAR